MGNDSAMDKWLNNPETQVATAQKAGREPEPGRNGRWSGYAQLLLARMKEMKREPEVIFWVFFFPILLALGLGIAFRDRPPQATNVAIEAGPGAGRIVHLLKLSPKKQSIHWEVLPSRNALNQFRLGKFDLVVRSSTDGHLDFSYDPARPESVLARTTVGDALEHAAGQKDVIAITSSKSNQPGARYIDFLIPGLLGMNLMNSGMWGIGFALVEMRQRKLLKRLIATPMRRGDFLMALASSRLILMLIELVLLLGFGMIFFHIRVEGSWLAIIAISAIGSLCFGGVGLLTASRAQKIESVSGLINVVMMPMWIFSGVFFSYQRFPAAVQPLIRALPLTALNDALRSTILEGTPIIHQGWRLLNLLLWGGISFLLAKRWFRWT